jgi:hypothetical protein
MAAEFYGWNLGVAVPPCHRESQIFTTFNATELFSSLRLHPSMKLALSISTDFVSSHSRDTFENDLFRMHAPPPSHVHAAGVPSARRRRDSTPGLSSIFLRHISRQQCPLITGLSSHEVAPLHAKGRARRA